MGSPAVHAAAPVSSEPPLGTLLVELSDEPYSAPAAAAPEPDAPVDGGEANGPSVAEAHDADKTPVPSVPRDTSPHVEGGPIRIRYFGRTNVGLVREHNEDNFMVADLAAGLRGLEDEPREIVLDYRGAVFAVCDGMGGAAAGEVASQLAVDVVYESLQGGDETPDRDVFARRLVCSIEEAGNRIFEEARADRTRRGMGTTSTVAGLIDKVLFVGQVGDSRAYVLRENELALVTKDQSLVNQLIESGQLTEEEAEAFEHSNIILQALGTTEEVSVDLTFLELRRGDRLLLCSDGLSGLVHADMIREVLAATRSLPEACDKLIELANAGGGHDNVTCVIVDFDGPGLPAPGDARATYQQYPLPDDEPTRPSVSPRDSRRPVRVVPAPRSDGLAEWDAPRPFRWWLVALVLAGCVAVVAVMSGEPPVPTADAPAAEPPAAHEPAALAPPSRDPTHVRIRVTTDLEAAELFVDGRAYGALDDEGSFELDLAPGTHRFEARSEGTTLAAQNVAVAPGADVDVELVKNVASGVASSDAVEAGEDDGLAEDPQHGDDGAHSEPRPVTASARNDLDGDGLTSTRATPSRGQPESETGTQERTQSGTQSSPARRAPAPRATRATGGGSATPSAAGALDAPPPRPARSAPNKRATGALPPNPY